MKKRMLSRVGFTIIAVASLFLANHGYAYDMADYYPLEQGFTWTMQETWNNDPSYEDTMTIDGFEDVGGVTTVKMVDDDGGYTCVAFNSEVLGIYKSADSTFDIYISFTPPAALLPAEAEMGEDPKSYSSAYTVYVDGDPVAAGTFVNTYSLVGVVDVSVPAGDFSGCLEFKYAILDTKTSGNDTGYRDATAGTFWLAPDVGMVKSEFTMTEYNDQNQVIEESSVVSVLLSYDRGGGGGGDDDSGCFISAACGFSMAR